MKNITNQKDVKLTFKKFWNTSELNSKILNAISSNRREDLIKILRTNGLNSNYCVGLEDTSVPILVLAAKMGHGSIASWLLNNKADPDVFNGEPLEIAILNANIGLLKMLLKHGANPNSGNGRLLLLAAKKNLLGALEELVNHGGKITSKISKQLFDIAHKNNNYDMMRYISDMIALSEK